MTAGSFLRSASRRTVRTSVLTPDGDLPLSSRRTGPAHARSERRRSMPALLGGAAILVVVAVAGLAAHNIHLTPAATTSAPPHTAPHAASAATAARLEAASNDVVSATTAARAGFAALHGMPTTAAVATIVNPYLASLQLYGTFLSGTQVPATARPAAASTEAQLHKDIAYLEGVNGLAPIDLGAFLSGFFGHAAQLETQLGRFERALGPHAHAAG